MIPNVAGAALVGWLMLVLSAMVTLGLLTWWGYRFSRAARGTPLPPLGMGSWWLAVVLSLLPIFTAVSGLQLWWSEQRSERLHTEQDIWRHLTLRQPTQWGPMVLPAGSHVQRELPAPWLVVDTSILDELPDGSPDLRALSAVRFAQPQLAGDVWVKALSVYPPLLELAQPYAAGGAHCQEGELLVFEARHAATMPAIQDSPVPPPQVWADWQVRSCFLGAPIALRYWKDGALVWAMPEAEAVRVTP